MPEPRNSEISESTKEALMEINNRVSEMVDEGELDEMDVAWFLSSMLAHVVPDRTMAVTCLLAAFDVKSGLTVDGKMPNSVTPFVS